MKDKNWHKLPKFACALNLEKKILLIHLLNGYWNSFLIKIYILTSRLRETKNDDRII